MRYSAGKRVYGLRSRQPVPKHHPQYREAFRFSGFEFVQDDVRDEAVILRLAEGATILVDLAAFKIPRHGNALDTLTINIHGTESVLKAAKEHKSRVVFASTSDVCTGKTLIFQSSTLTISAWARPM